MKKREMRHLLDGFLDGISGKDSEIEGMATNPSADAYQQGFDRGHLSYSRILERINKAVDDAIPQIAEEATRRVRERGGRVVSEPLARLFSSAREEKPPTVPDDSPEFSSAGDENRASARWRVGVSKETAPGHYLVDLFGPRHPDFSSELVESVPEAESRAAWAGAGGSEREEVMGGLVETASPRHIHDPAGDMPDAGQKWWLTFADGGGQVRRLWLPAGMAVSGEDAVAAAKARSPELGETGLGWHVTSIEPPRGG